MWILIIFVIKTADSNNVNGEFINNSSFFLLNEYILFFDNFRSLLFYFETGYSPGLELII